MEKRRFGKTDMEVSILGFGSSEIGYLETPQEEVDRMLNDALDSGLNVVDTAECYPHSEEKIGQAIGHRRREFYIFTKCGHADGVDGFDDWDPRLIEMQIDRSLRRLRTDRLDLIQLHSCSEELLRAGELIEILQRAKEAGKARYIGYSGDNEAARYAIECGAFDALQTSINIADQRVIEANLPLAEAVNLGVIAKRPVANAAWRNWPEPPASNYAKPYYERLKQLDYPFLGDSDRTFAQALRFTLSLPGVHTAIVGTTKPGRWQANASLLAEGLLPGDQITAIRDRWEEAAHPAWAGLG